MKLAYAPAIRGGAAVLGLLFALLIQPAYSGAAQGTCVVLAEGDQDALSQVEGLHCVTGISTDLELQASWSVSGNDLNSRLVSVSLSAAAEQQVQLDVRLPGADSAFVSLSAADGGKSEASWKLLPGAYELHFAVTGAEGRFVFAAESLGDRWDISDTPVGAGARDGSASGSFQRIGSLQGGTDTVRWTVPEDGPPGQTWQLSTGGVAGHPLTVKLYDEDGAELLHHDVAEGAALELTDLELPAGVNTFVLSPAAGEPQAGYFLEAMPLGPHAGGSKQGRTGSPVGANRIDLAGGVSGALDEDNADYFHLRVDEDEAGFYELNLEADDGINSLCIEAAGGVELACSAVDGSLLIPLLQLTEGDYWFELNGRRNAQPAYSLSFSEVQAPADDTIVFAPAGTRSSAFTVPEAGGVRITHGSRATTWLRLEVPEPGLYRFQVQGDGDIRDLRVTDGGGTNIRSERQSRLDNVPLRTGTNFVALDALAGQYALRVLRVGDLPPAQEPQPAAPVEEVAATGALPAELERQEVAARPEGIVVPGTNHGSRSATNLVAGQDYTATSDGPDAFYRFTLLADSQVQLTLTPPEDADMRLRLAPRVAPDHSTDEPGEQLVLRQWLSAGDYSVQLRMNNDSHGWYTLRLDELDPLDLPLDLAPLNPANARPLPADHRLVLPGSQENMHFLLPVMEADTTLQVVINEGPFGDLHVLPHPETRSGQRLSRLAADEEAGTFTVELEQDVQYHVELQSRSGEDWDLEFAFAGGVEPEQLTDPREVLELELELAADSVAAWSGLGQAVDAELTVTNTGNEAVRFDLHSHGSDPRAYLDGLPADLALAAGETVELPFSLLLPDDLRSDRLFRLTIGLSDQGGRTATASEELLASCDAPHVSPAHWTPEPFAGLSYWNHALAAFGATITGDPARERHDNRLTDGRVSVLQPTPFAVGTEFTLELQQDVTVQAIALQPVGGGSANNRLRDFELAVSTDGENWETVLNDSLSGAAIEQVFELPEERTLSHARLTLLSSQDRSSTISLGEFKLLGSEPPLARVNLADPQLGGHVVHGNVWPGMTAPLEGPEDGPGDTRPHVTVDEDTGPLELVLGFHENRAALISALQWQDYALRGSRYVYIPEVAVHVSTESPLGPWEHVADWQLQRPEGAGEEAPDALDLELDEPVWARFVRITEITDSAERRQLNLPSPLRVFEHGHAGDYRSIVSEWGMDRQTAVYEHMHPELIELATVEFGANGAESSAAPLTEQSDGFVQTGNFVAWYELTVPEGMNQLSLDIASGSSVALEYELLDAAGETVATGHSGEPLSLTVESAATYMLRIAEPPRSIAFVWDNSGSVSPFSAMTYAALDEFAGGISADMEEVMLAVFSSGGANFLLPDWSGSAEEVTRALNAYDRSDGSSAAGAAMIAVNQEIAGRQGSRVLLLITDAATGYGDNPEVWRGIEAAGTQIFTMHVSSDSTADTQDYMQDLASANGGWYAATPTYADLETGFARADCHIRRPKPYGVSVAFEQREAQPGQLSVSLPAEADDEVVGAGLTAAGTGAIQVILDASGSMWQTLDGRFRYQVASDVLVDLVTGVLPEEVPFALRVFGNREADVCRTDLEVALAPLEAGAVAAAIADIEPQQFAGTPLAESILLARQDLAEASGPRTLILITDGEESCDGDVEGAISELRAEGFDVVLNIIGFDFDADDVEAARQRFRDWAELGGGQYFDATDAAELATALERSVAPPFEVVAADGTVVARGTVGGSAVDVAGGTYSVRILAEPGQLVHNVVIDGELLEVELPDGMNGDD